MSETTDDIESLVRNYVHNAHESGVSIYPYIPEQVADEMDACPFCDAEPSNFWDLNEGKEDEASWVVTCGHCGAQGPPASTFSEAVAVWNKRS
jgi:DNA-directed RNA polymerase subunit M/transcription elongation factor TFIIS